MDSKTESKLVDLAQQIKDSYSPAEIAKLVRLIEPTPSTGEMSSDDFEKMMNLLDETSTRRKFSEKSREAARLVFVMGANSPEAANQTGLKVQGVDQLIRRIRGRLAAVPNGWIPVTAWFPADVAGQVKDLAKTLIAVHQSGDELVSSYSITLSQS